jgi:Zn-dependent metalloprotease
MWFVTNYGEYKQDIYKIFIGERVMRAFKYRCILRSSVSLLFCTVLFFNIWQGVVLGQDAGSGGGQGTPESLLSHVRSVDNPRWKAVWDKRNKVAKRLFNAKSKPFPGKPEDAARKFLSAYHELFGLNADIANVQLKSCIKTPLGNRVTFKQFYKQLPIVGAEVTAHVSDKNSVFFVENRCIPVVETETQPSVEESDAIVIAEKALAVDAAMVQKASSELVILPHGSEMRLAWRVIVSKKGLIDKTWLVYVDAKKKGWILYKKKLQLHATGTGKVYMENPITTPTQTAVSLKNLTDNSFAMEGDYTKTYNAECFYSVDNTSNLSGLSTAFSSERDYSYTISDKEMEEVMVYYHLNTMHDTLKSTFGFDSIDDQIPVFVNAQDPDNSWLGYDNAFYTRDGNFSSTGYLLFGCGYELNNLGLDADVITHEYGHATLDHIQPDLFEAVEHNYGGAIHESVGDVMASYFGGNKIIGEWGLTSRDGRQDYTRNMDNNRTYPTDVYDSSGMSEVHYTGEILNGAYWDIQETVGSGTAFQLFLSAMSVLPGDADFFDVRDAWLTADSSLHGGANSSVIETAFAGHGIEGDDPANAGATILLKKMVFYKYDTITGTMKKQKNFRRGDIILVYLKADIADLTPAYNLIPVEFSVSGNGAETFEGESYYSEALEGVHGYEIGYLLSDSAKGRITVKAKVRLGGTDTVAEKTGTFVIK